MESEVRNRVGVVPPMSTSQKGSWLFTERSGTQHDEPVTGLQMGRTLPAYNHRLWCGRNPDRPLAF